MTATSLVRSPFEGSLKPPVPARERHVLLDANAIIDAANGRAAGLLGLIREPAPGFTFWTTEGVRNEVRFLPGRRPEDIFRHILLVESPKWIDPRILETRGADFSLPSRVDAELLQLVLVDERFSILVTSDGFHRRSGLAVTLGIAHRFRVEGPRDFVKRARRRRPIARPIHGGIPGALA